MIAWCMLASSILLLCRCNSAGTGRCKWSVPVMIITIDVPGKWEIRRLIRMSMKANMGPVDRLVRVLLAAVAVVLYHKGLVTGTLGMLLLILAGVFVVTSLIRSCPLYTLFGINTRPR